MNTLKKKHKLSAEIYKEFKSKPEFNEPHDLLDAVMRAKKATGLYPVYTKSRSAEKFIRFLNEKELADFKQFSPKPRWKPHGDKKYGLKIFDMEVADVYAGNMFPDRTPYEISAMWRKGGLFDGEGPNVRYEVDIFIDCGNHIDTQTVDSDKPIPLKKVLAQAVKQSLEIKGKCFDGYWY